jgi:hypothetical protein
LLGSGSRCRRAVFTLLSAVVSSFLHLLCELIIVNLRRLQMILNRTIPIHAAGTVSSRIWSVGRAFTLSSWWPPTRSIIMPSACHGATPRACQLTCRRVSFAEVYITSSHTPKCTRYW